MYDADDPDLEPVALKDLVSFCCCFLLFNQSNFIKAFYKTFYYYFFLSTENYCAKLLLMARKRHSQITDRFTKIDQYNKCKNHL